MRQPSKINSGERIAILSPASVVDSVYIDGAAEFLRLEGFEPVIMPHAKGPAHGSYAASDSERLNDLISAYTDPGIKAILCARGGYGCNHLLAVFDKHIIAANPKWLIGFSDISALHCLSLKSGVMSLHAPMAKHLSRMPHDDVSSQSLMKILKEGLALEYEVPGNPLSRPGRAEGTLVGGNLAVINGLADTPIDPLNIPGPKILFLEDISEAIYSVERMLIRLILSGRLNEVEAIIFGQFTEYKSDRNFQDMETMISSLFSQPYAPKMPLALGFPSGHTDYNLPLVLGARVCLETEKNSIRLRF